MDTSAKAIKYFLNLVGRPTQLSLTLRRFRGKFTGGEEEEYYFGTVIPHKVEVYNNGLKLVSDAKSYHDFKNRRLIDHDLSKFSKDEKSYSSMNFEIPDENSAKQLLEFNKAWHHHKHFNSHHPEHWFSVNKFGLVDILPMPYDDILEMVVNWMSKDEDFEGFLAENLSNYVFHNKTAENLQKILDKLGISTKSVANKNFLNAKMLK
jgi:hypothetical protein